MPWSRHVAYVCFFPRTGTSSIPRSWYLYRMHYTYSPDNLYRQSKEADGTSSFSGLNGDEISNKIELDRLHSFWTAEFNYKRPGARCADSKTVSCTITGSNFRQFPHYLS